MFHVLPVTMCWHRYHDSNVLELLRILQMTTAMNLTSLSPLRHHTIPWARSSDVLLFTTESIDNHIR